MKQLLENIFSQLKLKDKPFITFESAKDEEIDTMWKEILKVDQTLTTSDTTKLKISTKEQFKSFLVSHCCQQHYMFPSKRAKTWNVWCVNFPVYHPTSNHYITSQTRYLKENITSRLMSYMARSQQKNIARL